MELYASWCGHCKQFAPTYEKLAKKLQHIDSLVIAKMEGSKNEHPKATANGYPTILFYPAGADKADKEPVNDTTRFIEYAYSSLMSDPSSS